MLHSAIARVPELQALQGASATMPLRPQSVLRPHLICPAPPAAGQQSPAPKAVAQRGRVQQRGLTPHSSRAPTAKHRARAAVHVIICSAGPAFRCRCRLSSNVRPRVLQGSRLSQSRSSTQRKCLAPATLVSVFVGPYRASWHRVVSRRYQSRASPTYAARSAR